MKDRLIERGLRTLALTGLGISLGGAVGPAEGSSKGDPALDEIGRRNTIVLQNPDVLSTSHLGGVRLDSPPEQQGEQEEPIPAPTPEWVENSNVQIFLLPAYFITRQEDRNQLVNEPGTISIERLEELAGGPGGAGNLTAPLRGSLQHILSLGEFEENELSAAFEKVVTSEGEIALIPTIRITGESSSYPEGSLVIDVRNVLQGERTSDWGVLVDPDGRGDISQISFDIIPDPQGRRSALPINKTLIETLGGNSLYVYTVLGIDAGRNIREISAIEAVVNTEGTYLRLRDENANIINELPSGSVVAVVDQSQRFLKINGEDVQVYKVRTADGLIGYVASSFLRTQQNFNPETLGQPLPRPEGVEEIEAENQNVINLQEYNGVPWPDENMRITPSDRVQYVGVDEHITQGQIVITSADGRRREYQIFANGIHDQVRVRDEGTFKIISVYGTFQGVLGTRTIQGTETTNPATGESVDFLSFDRIEVVDIRMSVNIDNRQTTLVVTLPREQIFGGYIDGSETPPPPRSTDEVLALFEPGVKTSVLLLLPNGEWGEFLTSTVIPRVQPEGPLVIRQNLALVGVTLDQYRTSVEALSINSASGIIYVGSTYNIIRA